MIREITRVRNLTNGTPSRFNLQAGDLCYAQAQGDIQPIINPDGPNGSQPSSGNTPMPPANSGGWDYYDPWIWTSWFPMIEASAARRSRGCSPPATTTRAVLRAGGGRRR